MGNLIKALGSPLAAAALFVCAIVVLTSTSFLASTETTSLDAEWDQPFFKENVGLSPRNSKTSYVEGNAAASKLLAHLQTEATIGMPLQSHDSRPPLSSEYEPLTASQLANGLVSQGGRPLSGSNWVEMPKAEVIASASRAPLTEPLKDQTLADNSRNSGQESGLSTSVNSRMPLDYNYVINSDTEIATATDQNIAGSNRPSPIECCSAQN